MFCVQINGILIAFDAPWRTILQLWIFWLAVLRFWCSVSAVAQSTRRFHAAPLTNIYVVSKQEIHAALVAPAAARDLSWFRKVALWSPHCSSFRPAGQNVAAPGHTLLLYGRCNKSAQSNLGRGPRRGVVAHIRRKVPIGYNGAP